MQRIWADKKGISPVIAALLLVGIAVAAAIVTHSWVMSMIKMQGGQAQTAIRTDLLEFTGASNEWINMTIRNVGSVSARIETVYVTVGDKVTYMQDYKTGNVISVGDKVEFCFGTDEDPTGFSWEFGSTYNIKIVTSTGFAVEGTYYSPSS